MSFDFFAAQQKKSCDDCCENDSDRSNDCSAVSGLGIALVAFRFSHDWGLLFS
jgi:hypothetical protein